MNKNIIGAALLLLLSGCATDMAPKTPIVDTTPNTGTTLQNQPPSTQLQFTQTPTTNDWGQFIPPPGYTFTVTKPATNDSPPTYILIPNKE